MKRYSKVAAVLTLLVFAAASGPAMAQHGGRGGWDHHGGGHWHGGGWDHHGGGHWHGRGLGYALGLGLALSIPLLLSDAYTHYATPAPAYTYPVPAPAYTYTAPAYSYSAPAQAPQQDWYFCPDSNGYYPYVRECPGGWQRVPSVPPR